MPDSEIVMYIIVNKEVKMSPGKLAAQASHSACKASHMAEQSLHSEDRNWWGAWWHGYYAKIVLKASEFEMKHLMDKYGGGIHPTIVFTRDEGRTEIPRGTLTSLAFIPMPKDRAPEELGKLELR